MGLADGPPLELRRATARVAFCESRLRSLELSYLLHHDQGLDPAVSAHSLPLSAWARVVWQNKLPLDQLEGAFKWAVSRVEGSARPWLRVVGPAGATVCTLVRLGWQPLGASQWRDDRGVLLDLARVCPRTVEKLVGRAVRRNS